MSSSEEDEEGGRIRFTTEGDYDEGQWMDDGEFYARGGVRFWGGSEGREGREGGRVGRLSASTRGRTESKAS
jgi:hypothetical protein